MQVDQLDLRTDSYVFQLFDWLNSQSRNLKSNQTAAWACIEQFCKSLSILLLINTVFFMITYNFDSYSSCLN